MVSSDRMERATLHHTSSQFIDYVSLGAKALTVSGGCNSAIRTLLSPVFNPLKREFLPK
jgi:hypothetical protein